MVVKREKSMGMEVGESSGKRAPKAVESRDADRRDADRCVCLRLYATYPGYLPAFTSSGDVSLKLSADSAGKTISLLPGNASPPVPPAARAAARIAAPSPPPAHAPMLTP